MTKCIEYQYNILYRRESEHQLHVICVAPLLPSMLDFHIVIGVCAGVIPKKNIILRCVLISFLFQVCCKEILEFSNSLKTLLFVLDVFNESEESNKNITFE